METKYQAFWSYTHEDDERLRGYVTRLSERIVDEYAVSSGDELEIFLDRKSLQWGEVWRSKIDGALGNAPLFIAVVTPKFVKSQECRKELLSFVAESKSGGFSRLLLPILLIDVPGMKEDSEDEVLALLARTQYVSWTKLRLMAEDSPEVLTAVNALALRIIELQEEVQSDLQAVEQRGEEDKEKAVDEIFKAINELLPDWLEAVDFDPVAKGQWNATWQQREDRAERVFQQRRGVSGAYLSVWAKLGNEVAHLSTSRLAQAKTYHRLTIALDPYITSAVRLIEREPQFIGLLDELVGGVREAMIAIEGKNKTDRWFYDPNVTQYSTSLKKAVDDLVISTTFVTEANAIVHQWSDRIEELAREVTVTPSSLLSGEVLEHADET
jgi:hypothetical protein